MIQITNSVNDLSIDGHSLNVFFSDCYASFERSQGHTYVYLYTESFIIPVSITKKYIFKYAHFTTEPAILAESGCLKSFLTEVCEYLSTVFKVQWINCNSTSSLFAEYPDNSKHIPFGSHVVNLSLSEEDLWKNVHSKHRNVIKKAEKDGVIIEKGISEKLITDYHRIDVLTWSRSNKGTRGKDALTRSLEILKGNAIIYMAYKDDEPQSGAIYYYNQSMCYYLYGANCDRPLTGSGNLLQWNAMLDMKANGVERFSFVGCRINEDENSKYHGIQRFKERFGGELIQGYMFKIDFNPIYHFLFNILVALSSFRYSKRFQLPKDVVDQEIHKWIQ